MCVLADGHPVRVPAVVLLVLFPLVVLEQTLPLAMFFVQLGGCAVVQIQFVMSVNYDN